VTAFALKSAEKLCNNRVSQPLPQKNMQSFNTRFVGLLKLPAVMVLLLLYLGATLLLAAMPLPRGRRLRIRTGNASFFSRLALGLLGVRVHTMHRERLRTAHRRGCLVVANHVSYVDVLALSALMPAVFITSVELGNTPLLGWLARSAGSLFVERRKASGLRREIGAIAALLNAGVPVILFPEANTSNGDRVHPFKRSLFDAAVAARSDILPLCLRYTRINGHPVTSENRDSVFYHGGMTFSRHVPSFLGLRSVDLEIIPLHSIRVHAGASRKNLAEQAHELISKEYDKRG
jgi:1-acyl-sn-glycerol-3-phosphate acyltransferase